MDIIIRILWTQPQVRFSVAVGLVLAAVVGLLRARSGRSWIAPACLVASLSLTLGVTLFSWRGPGGVGPGPDPLSQCRLLVEWASLPTELRSPGGLLNIALFAPLGLFATLVWRRPIIVVLGAVALSACIEITQAFGGAHDCTSTDTIANTTGALLGAGLAWIVMSRVHARSPRARTPTDRL